MVYVGHVMPDPRVEFPCAPGFMTYFSPGVGQRWPSRYTQLISLRAAAQIFGKLSLRVCVTRNVLMLDAITMRIMQIHDVLLEELEIAVASVADRYGGCNPYKPLMDASLE